tara:strand:+ start:37 stop:660 length:624 start_codon:yes stop_codon:yes gene_type:complete
MSTIKTTNITHGSNSGTNNLILDDTGKVSIAEKKLYCPGTIIQVKSVHFNSGVASQSHPAQNSSQSWWEYDNANLRIGITPTTASNKILVMGHVTVGANVSTAVSFRIYRRLGSGTGAMVGSNTATNGTAYLCFGSTLIDQTNQAYTQPFTYLDTPANASDEHVYYLGFNHNSSSNRELNINTSGDDSNNYACERGTSGITLMEVAG